MKKYDRFLIAVLISVALVFVAVNLYFRIAQPSASGDQRVQVERAVVDIERSGFSELDRSKYPMIVGIETLNDPDDADFYAGDNREYAIRRIDGVLYRFDYIDAGQAFSGRIAWVTNLALAAMALIVTGVLIYLRSRMLAPFHRMTELPYELAKGNLTAPLKESRSRFFGRYVWGMDLLRDKMEKQKDSELQLRKEKKTLILSLSHDINTPLSAIKLYSKALSKNIYDSPQKTVEVAEHIHENADEIEEYVSRIIRASREDFPDIPVRDGEFYLSEVIRSVRDYYTEKLLLLHTRFTVDDYSDCMLKGDPDRAVEVLQNLLENAIKYGDGASIRIGISEEEDCRLITVENSGCTLPKGELAHIFESYWRGSNAANRGGSGLGLHICRRLMNRMGGEIYASIEDGQMRVTAVFRKA